MRQPRQTCAQPPCTPGPPPLSGAPASRNAAPGPSAIPTRGPRAHSTTLVTSRGRSLRPPARQVGRALAAPASDELPVGGVVELEYVLRLEQALLVRVGERRLGGHDVGAALVRGQRDAAVLDQEAQVEEVLDRLLGLGLGLGLGIARSKNFSTVCPGQGARVSEAHVCAREACLRSARLGCAGLGRAGLGARGL